MAMLGELRITVSNVVWRLLFLAWSIVVTMIVLTPLVILAGVWLLADVTLRLVTGLPGLTPRSLIPHGGEVSGMNAYIHNWMRWISQSIRAGYFGQTVRYRWLPPIVPGRVSRGPT